MRGWLCLFLCCIAGSVYIAAPGKSYAWRLKEITGHLPDLMFSLTDSNGLPVTQQAYHGKTTLLYFGFTGCSAQCPTTLSRVAQVFKRLATQSGQAQLLFVTIDPAHDGPDNMKRYLQHFDASRMIGLTGSMDAIAALARRNRALYRPDVRISPNTPHSDTLYVFDQAGHARLLATASDTDEALTHDLQQLADEN